MSSSRALLFFVALSAPIAVALIAVPFTAHADTGNFDLSGKLYTKFMYKNDDSQGCLSLSNPFWKDNIGGSNGVCSEFELNVKGRVSKYVTTGVRLQSRWGALWQDWWENGDVRWDFPNNSPFYENTSGESLGQNHAQYIKLRGTFIRAALPIPTVQWAHIGASDFGMFNEWTIGKSRYIDRDNGQGVFLEGAFDSTYLRYHTAAIALPKLYVGPRWNTGLKDADPLAGFWGADWAYAAKLASTPIPGLDLSFVGIYIHDWEADRNDPDNTGPTDSDRGADHAIDRVPRFQAVNATLDAEYTPESYDKLTVSGLLAFSHNDVNPAYATNSVAGDQGFSPVLFLTDENGNPTAAQSFAGKLLIELFDPLDAGLTFKVEYFNIGKNFNAIFGARREADVLLTDGIIGGGFISGGQLPTLNIANEFVDFDEPWFESIIGWHGATGLVEYTGGELRGSLEYTLITYNTNGQNVDTDHQYPDFLYTDGFTDVNAYTADFDYANVYDRGRDPRSVYAEFKKRLTHVAVLKGEYLLPFGTGLVLSGKVKLVHDEDNRNAANPDDNYRANAWDGFLNIRYQVNDELQSDLGYEVQYWDERKRSGSQETGYFDGKTLKHIARLRLGYNFGGLSIGYLLEYFGKQQLRDRPGSFDQEWQVWRSKATVEAAW